MERIKIRATCFLILGLSILFVASQGTLNSYMNKSWADSPTYFGDILKNYYIKIQDKSQNGLELPPKIVENSEGVNQTGNGLTEQVLSGEGDSEDNNQSSTETASDQTLSGEVDSEDNNQSSTQTSGGSESNQNTNQSTVTQNQIQNNQEVNIQNNVQLKQKLEIAISEEEGEAPIPLEDQKRIESLDRDIVPQHKALTGPDCRTGNVLAGSSNEKDLRILSECQEAIGIVMHTKKMDDGDFKFFLKLDDKFKFLTNEKNGEKTDGFLVVEIVPPDQGKSGIILPKEGDHVHIWGVWVTDKPKGWHEKNLPGKLLMNSLASTFQ